MNHNFQLTKARLKMANSLPQTGLLLKKMFLSDRSILDTVRGLFNKKWNRILLLIICLSIRYLPRQKLDTCNGLRRLERENLYKTWIMLMTHISMKYNISNTY